MQGDSVTPKKVRLAACVSTKSVVLNIVTFRLVTRSQHIIIPGAPLTYFNDGGGKGGGRPSEFFESDILAKKDFLGSIKDAGIFFGSRKKTE